MKNRWNNTEVALVGEDLLSLRVYTSRLLGADPALVLHGGGNTSVKTDVPNLFGERESVLYVKGSGWDLATIKEEGFAPVKMEMLLKMAELRKLSDTEMVKWQRAAMLDPSAPNPSVEAILHAIIPFRFVDHTHADAVVTISNSPDGERLIREIYGDRVVVIPYVMPGFLLSRKVYEMTRNMEWDALEGLILLHHGVFTFGDDPKVSYERMISLVSEAEAYLADRGAFIDMSDEECAPVDLPALAAMRRHVSRLRGRPVLASLDTTGEAVRFSCHPDVADLATRGVLTPEHVIRNKREALIVGECVEKDLAYYAEKYESYFERHGDSSMTALHPAPCWGVWPGVGTIAFGTNPKEVQITTDIVRTTRRCISQAEVLGGWSVLPEKDVFDIEYWELEQAKLKTEVPVPVLQGKVALVTGGASGIGKACVHALSTVGAVVIALDINPAIEQISVVNDILGIRCDVTDACAVQKAVCSAVSMFGGLDVLITNAGNLPESGPLSEGDEMVWDKSLALNLTSHRVVLQACIPFLKEGIDPSVVVIASKNVPAPGPGMASYSVPKAGLTQLARIAAMELAPSGIRVNILHPDAVFDTGLWSDHVLCQRASHYEMTVEQYKKRNLLQVEVSSADVAALACALAGPIFGKTTGAQIPVDGGNDRVI